MLALNTKMHSSSMRAVSCSGRFGGVCPGGVHPPVDRMIDACENITFSQLLLQTVKIQRLNLRVRLETLDVVKLMVFRS